MSRDLAYLSACYSIFISDNYQNIEIKTLNIKTTKKNFFQQRLWILQSRIIVNDII